MSERNKPILRLVLVCLLSLLYSSLITHHSLLSLHSSLPAGKPNEPTFLVHTADGSDPRGTLRKLAEDWSLRLGGTKPALVAGTDLVSLRRSEVPLQACQGCPLVAQWRPAGRHAGGPGQDQGGRGSGQSAQG